MGIVCAMAEKKSYSTLRFHVYMTTEEKAFVEERARKNGMSVAEYLRFATLWEAVTSGEPAGFALFGKRLSAHTMNLVSSWYERFKAGAKRMAEKNS